MAPIPIIHITDLHTPPHDPDDHIDLATLYSLPEFDVRAVVLDYSGPVPGGYPVEPGFVPVVQLNYLTGRSVPVATGPPDRLSAPDDAAADRPLREQAGIELILRVLAESREPVYISSVGSARTITAAFNREPEMVRDKVRAVLLSAGSTGSFLECNVEIDPAAYVGLLRSGLTVHWYPCATGEGPFGTDAHNGFWRTSHRALFDGVPQPLRAWFTHSLSGNLRGDIIRALDEQGILSPWDNILSAPSRSLWSTAMFVMAAERVLALTNNGWRFVPRSTAPVDSRHQRLEIEPVKVAVRDDGITSWEPATDSNILLYRRDPGPEHTEAMAEALNALLRSIPVGPQGDGK